MRVRRLALALLTAGVAMLACGTTARAAPSPISREERARVREMLDSIRQTLGRNYYDRTYHGLDLETRFKDAERKLETASSVAQAYGVIAQALMGLGDSHTFFIPPARPSTYDTGWDMRMIGDECLITSVNPASDAAAKGLRPGDRLLQLESFRPSRSELWKLRYAYSSLAPRPVLRIVAQGPDGAPRQLDVSAKVTREPATVPGSMDDAGYVAREAARQARLTATSAVRLGAVAVWRLASFDFPPEELEHAADQVLPGAGALVLDLRGNAGGLINTLQRLTGRLFDRDVKIADRVGRRPMAPLTARRAKAPFTGGVVVLVDAASASASELLARTVQLEHRGVVIGDRSAGSVREARLIPMTLRVGPAFVVYSASVTDADLVMTDGRSLEGTGVIPDELILPTQADLAGRRDPALARAATRLGAPLNAQDAGSLLPPTWK